MYLGTYNSEEIWEYIIAGIYKGLRDNGHPMVPRRGKKDTYKNKLNNPWMTRN